MMKYTFWVSVLMMLLAIVLIWTGKGLEGTASTIIGSVSGYWLGQSNNEKPVKKSNNNKGA